MTMPAALAAAAQVTAAAGVQDSQTDVT